MLIDANSHSSEKFALRIVTQAKKLIDASGLTCPLVLENGGEHAQCFYLRK